MAGVHLILAFLRVLSGCVLAADLTLRPLLAEPAITAYHVDTANSHATVHVGKAGAFSFIAGHTHEVVGPIESGSIEFDRDDPRRSQVRIVIAAQALKVSGAGEPPDDVPKVQQAMESEKVLDVARYPRITFESADVRIKGHHDTSLDVVMVGRLTVRAVTQPLAVPVHVDVTDEAVRATGRFSIRQSLFGITPISVGGVVAVKDELDISFSILARRR